MKHVIAVHYESLNYDEIENDLLVQEEQERGYSYVFYKEIWRWVTFFLIGVGTAIVGFSLESTLEILTHYKYSLIKDSIDECYVNECLYIPYLMWLGINVGSALIGTYMVTYLEPVAGGSGVPLVKAFLNGVRVPHVTRFKTFVIKILGVVSAIVGGLAVGKEGPMIHAGAIIGSGFSQGRSDALRINLHFFSYFREDRQQRGFVAGGAAAGVSAAFGSPIGATLFILEEASFWSESQTWRTLFGAMIAAFVADLLLSGKVSDFGEMGTEALLNFGKFDDITFLVGELVLFMLIGVLGGVFGALFNFCSLHMFRFRRARCRHRLVKMCEVGVVAAMSATMGMLSIYLISDCKNLGTSGEQFQGRFPLEMSCAQGNYNSVTTLWLQSFSGVVRSLFHEQEHMHSLSSLFIYLGLFFVLFVCSNGLSTSYGLFIPSMVLGATYGRIVGVLVYEYFPHSAWNTPGKFALLGATAQMAGTMRMTVSLSVIMIESTGISSFGLPLIITVFCAKWVGEFLFTESIYEVVLGLIGIPMLGWEPPAITGGITAAELMSSPVVTFKLIEPVSNIVDTLQKCSHNGFPVLSAAQAYRGIILRTQLITLLDNRFFQERQSEWDTGRMHLDLFRKEYSRTTLSEVTGLKMTSEDRAFTINIEPYINRASYTVQKDASLPQVFRLFRGLGLRHITVVDDACHAVGMITRVDIARYHTIFQNCGCRMSLEKLPLQPRP